MACKYSTQLFRLSNGETVECYSTDTRNGFCHHAEMYVAGRGLVHVRISYYNRTWERFRYESVLDRICANVYGDATSICAVEIDRPTTNWVKL